MRLFHFTKGEVLYIAFEHSQFTIILLKFPISLLSHLKNTLRLASKVISAGLPSLKSDPVESPILKIFHFFQLLGALATLIILTK